MLKKQQKCAYFQKFRLRRALNVDLWVKFIKLGRHPHPKKISHWIHAFKCSPKDRSDFVNPKQFLETLKLINSARALAATTSCY
jgi:hypothetical protein